MVESDLSKTCGAIAELLQARAQTLPDLQQALEIGQRLGWPVPRLDAIRDEAAKLALATRRLGAVERAGPCAAAAAIIEFFGDVGRSGEVEALHSRIVDAARPRARCRGGHRVGASKK